MRSVGNTRYIFFKTSIWETLVVGIAFYRFKKLKCPLLSGLFFIAAILPDSTFAQCSPPAGVSGITAWLRASEGLTFQNESQLLSSWQDVSGCGNLDVSNTNASDMPTYMEEEAGHWPAIRFDGVNDVLFKNGAGLNARTLFIVLKMDSTNTTNLATVLSNGADSLNIRREGIGRQYRVELSDTLDFVYNAQADSNFRVNGQLKDSIPGGWHVIEVKSETSKLYNNFWLGNAQPSLSRFWGGAIAEVLIYNTDLSDADRNKIEKYLGEKYQIPQLFSGYDDWGYSLPVTLNTTNRGINVLSDVMDFPLYFPLDSSWADFSQMAAGGRDLRVTDEFGDPLPMEIQSWDETEQKASIWVRTDVTGNSETQTLHFYWGNPDAVSANNPSGVFQGTKGYGAVWHLEEDPESTPIYDKTYHENTGYLGSHWTSNDGVDGVVGKAFHFRPGEGEGNSIVINTKASLNSENFTLSGWFLTTQTGDNADLFQNPCLFDKGGNVMNAGWMMLLAQGSGRVNFATQGNFLQSVTDISDSSWHLITLVKTASQKKIYVDGNLDVVVGDSSMASNSNGLFIGARYSSANYFNGLMDEIRFESANRGDDWNRLYYQNVTNPALLFSIGNSGSTNRPEIGFTQSYVIPSAQIAQEPDGTGIVKIKFKIVDSLSQVAQINLFSYSVDDGASWIDIGGPGNILPADFFSADWEVSTDYGSAPEQTVDVNTRNIAEMKDQDLSQVRFRLQPKVGNNYGFFAVSEAVRVDNEYPTIILPDIVTPDPNPPISGTADEPLSFVQFVIEGDSLVGEVQGNGFSLPDNSLSNNLDSGLYTIIVTAKDTFGNPRTINGQLSINSKAPLVSIEPLLTRDRTPELRGQINDNTAEVVVEIQGAEYTADNLGDGSWVLADNTISRPLPSGVYDVLVKGINEYGLTGIDGTSGELTVDADSIVINIENQFTNSSKPDINGDINDPEANITLYISGAPYEAVNNGDGSWQLSGSVLPDLPEDSLLIIAEAIDSAGNFGFDSSGYVVVDITAPEVVRFSPNKSLTVFRPNLQVEFNEIVSPVAGEEINILSIDGDSIVESISISDSTVIVNGGKKINILYSASFQSGNSYGVYLGNSAVEDRAGNPYAGMESDTSWSFTIADSSVAFLDSISSSTPPGIYQKGDSIAIELFFNQAVTLRNGRLHLLLKTGMNPDTVSLEPFDLQERVPLFYVVNEGDSTAEFDVLELFLDSGAQLVNAADSAALLDIPLGSNISDRTTIILDAKEFILGILSPNTNTPVRSAAVSYEINKDAKWGKISWINGLGTDGKKLPEVELPLSGEHLLAGIHENVPLFPNLVSGGVYTVYFEFMDFSGNAESGFKELITITPPNSILIDFPKKILSIKDTLQLRAFGVDKDEEGNVTSEDSILIPNPDWEVIGDAEWVGPGKLLFNKMERFDVIVRSGGLADTIQVFVTSHEIKLSGGGASITLSPHLTVNVPLWESQKQISLPVLLTDSSEVNFKGMQQAGFLYKFEKTFVEALEFRFLPDTNFIGPDESHLAQLYCWPDGKNSKPILLDTERKSDGRLEFSFRNDTLGIFGLAVDRQVPTAKYKTVNSIRSDTTIEFNFTLEDNIQNYRAFLVLQAGGYEAPVKRPLEFENAKESKTSIDAEFFTEKGLSYWLEVSDGIQLAKVDTGHLSITMDQSMNLPVPLKNGEYVMMSIPQKPFANKVKNLLVPDWGSLTKTNWRLYEFNEGFEELESESRINPGKAYFVRTEGFEPLIEVPANSYSVLPLNEFKLALTPRWNAVASPFSFPVPLEKLRGFNKGQPKYIYELVDEVFIPLADEADLNPWGGYLIFNGQADSQWVESLIWKGLSDGKTSTSLNLSKTKVSNNLGVQINGKSKGKWVGAVSLSEAKAKWLLEYPVFPSRKSQFYIHQENQKLLHLESDPISQGIEWNVRAKISKHADLELDIFSEGYRKGFYLAVWDEVRNIWTDLGEYSPSKKLALNKSSGLESLHFYLGEKDWISEKKNQLNKALAFFIAQNYPNPFSGYTRFQFGLGWQQDDFSVEAELNIYNLNGKLLRKIPVKGTAGKRSEISWDGRDQNNKVIPSGTYFYQFKTARQASKVHKLVISR